ncbi:MAG: hypothetical protein LC790_17925, partial [Actinobacteria bacterium]|nr:hypothetical protein [Actinomycetota bacterium]
MAAPAMTTNPHVDVRLPPPALQKRRKFRASFWASPPERNVVPDAPPALELDDPSLVAGELELVGAGLRGQQR